MGTAGVIIHGVSDAVLAGKVDTLNGVATNLALTTPTIDEQASSAAKQQALTSLSNGIVTGKLSIGVGSAATIGGLQVTGGSATTTLVSNSSSLGIITVAGGNWSGNGFLFARTTSLAFSMVIGTDDTAYFGYVTGTAISKIVMQITTTGSIKFPGLAGTGSRAVVASADGTLSAP
jgi:hypothetical protein